jgi:hypothetical protein
MSIEPTLSPLAALEKVSSIGRFSCEGFLYDFDEDGMSACVEDLETGKFWSASGEYMTLITEETTWISLL